MANVGAGLENIIIPTRFTPYTRWLTKAKADLIKSGAVQPYDLLNELVGNGERRGGLLLEMPAWINIAKTATRVSSASNTLASIVYTGGVAGPAPQGITTGQETAVRLERNMSWSKMDLAAALAGDDPLAAIESMVVYFAVQTLQTLFVNTTKGVFADNALAPTGGDTHLQNDMTVDVSNDAGGVFSDQVTNFTAENFLRVKLLLGDQGDALKLVMMHSVTKNTLERNNMIDFIRDSDGVDVAYFRGAKITVDDEMPSPSSGVYETWFFGPGAMAFAEGDPDNATAIARHEEAGNGAGQTTLYRRWRWIMHPRGYRYVGSTADGQPSDATIAAAASWSRVFPERKQVPIARLISREF